MNKLKVCLLLFFVNASAADCQEHYSRYFDLNIYQQVGVNVVSQGEDIYVSFVSGCWPDDGICSGLFKMDSANFSNDPLWIDTVQNYQINRHILAANDKIYIAGRNVADWPLNQVLLLGYNPEGVVAQQKDFGPGNGNEFAGVLAFGNERIYFEYDQNTNPDTGNFLTLNAELEIIREFDFIESDPLDRLVASNLIVAPDGHLIGTAAVGQSNSFNGAITRFDTLGNVDWQIRLDSSATSSDNSFPRLDILPNNRYAVAWLTDPFLPLINSIVPTVYAIDSTGHIQWKHQVLIPTTSHIAYLYDIFTTSNGDVIGVGNSIRQEEEFLYDQCGWIFRVSGQGELLWERQLCDYTVGLDGVYATFLSGTELDNGDLIFVGNIELPPKPESPFVNNSGIWVVRTDANGCISPTCDSLVITDVAEEPTPGNTATYVNVFPNPARDLLQVALTTTAPGDYHWRLVSPAGRVLQQIQLQAGSHTQVETGSFPAGIYYYQLLSEGRILEAGKVVLLPK